VCTELYRNLILNEWICIIHSSGAQSLNRVHNSSLNVRTPITSTSVLNSMDLSAQKLDSVFTTLYKLKEEEAIHTHCTILMSFSFLLFLLFVFYQFIKLTNASHIPSAADCSRVFAWKWHLILKHVASFWCDIHCFYW